MKAEKGRRCPSFRRTAASLIVAAAARREFVLLCTKHNICMSLVKICGVVFSQIP
jgi:hypothetical protein